MKKWELARYLIESKKIVDSLSYIDKNRHKMSNLDLFSLIYEKQLHFYVTLCIFIDNVFNESERKLHKENDSLIKSLYYERDKYYAHKDKNYIKNEVLSISELVNKDKELVVHCFNISTDRIPKEITIDFVCHDRNLYRLMNSISPEIEDDFKKAMYKNQKIENHNINSKTYKLLNDTEDFKYIKNPDEYAVLIESGINMYEHLQNIQDSFIKTNLLYETNFWISLKNNVENQLKEYDEMVMKLISSLKSSM